MANSNRRTRGNKVRRSTPTGVLGIHKASQRWTRKARGKCFYFAKLADDPKGIESEAEWARIAPYVLAGREPPAEESIGPVVADAVNQFLDYKAELVTSGELTKQTWNEYNATCGVIVEQFGRDRAIADLKPVDFEQLRAKFAETAGPVRLGKLVQITKTLFKYAYDSGIIDAPLRFGQAFKRPSSSVLRRHKAQRGPKLFAPEEIRQLLDKANPTMRAFILLGVNAALGNADVARLEFRHVDLSGADGWGILRYPRGKTGIDRTAVLWPETCEAIREVIQLRAKPRDAKYKDRVFITSQRGTWDKDTSDNPVAKEFAKLLKAACITRSGASFYTLRHTARTIMDETGDFPGADMVMGHARNDMASIYRQRIGQERLRALAEHLRAWLFQPEGDDAREAAGEGDNEQQEAMEDEGNDQPTLKLYAG